MASKPVIIVGAGMGGLACALDLARQGIETIVLERAATAGGKLRAVNVDGLAIDSGPTVLTMRWVFEALLHGAGADLADEVTLVPADILARHAWNATCHLDLHADLDASAQAIGEFSGAREAAAFRAFSAEAAGIYRTLRDTFLKASRPGPIELTRRIGFHRLGSLFAIKPFSSMSGALSAHFQDHRLRQLFGRYATYCGSSPFLAPATLMLVAHVEQDGVWLVEGGMQCLADAMQRVAVRGGVTFRFGEDVRRIIVERGGVGAVELATGEKIAAKAVIWNGDVSALGDVLGDTGHRAPKPVPANARSLSAITWSMAAETSGFPLARHSVFFGADSAREFDDLFVRRRLPVDPTIYVCAQDRTASGARQANGRERLFVLCNAPADGDTSPLSAEETGSCATRTFDRLKTCGLDWNEASQANVVTTPSDFHRLFPGTGGALYGRASHGWLASFQRPGSRTALKGLYLAGGSAHPGAGLPMAALSGQLAAQALVSDLASTRPSNRVAISGGTSMAPATTAATRSR